jgi:hypothetical protein
MGRTQDIVMLNQYYMTVLAKKKSPPLIVVLVKKIVSWFKDVKNTSNA